MYPTSPSNYKAKPAIKKACTEVTRAKAAMEKYSKIKAPYDTPLFTCRRSKHYPHGPLNTIRKHYDTIHR